MINLYPHLTLKTFPDFDSNKTKVIVYYKVNNIVRGCQHIVDNDKLHEFIPDLLKRTEKFRINGQK